MLKIIALVLIIANANGIFAKTNYCTAGLCKPGQRHIACGNKGNFAARCPKDAKMVRIKAFKRLILKIHNTRRSFIARGKLRGFKPAKRMAAMRWDGGLARMAGLNVKRCIMRHDTCRNTVAFPQSGQNLGEFSYNGPLKSESNRKLIRSTIMSWWREYKNTNMRQIRSYPRAYSGPPIGHFTVMVSERNTHVGCAAIRFKKKDKHKFLMACNYGTTNIARRPVYRTGRAGSGCKTGRNRRYKGLCSTREKYA